VGFDITRAVNEAFGGRISFLDRVLSYLYFADVTMMERLTSDDYGSGVSIIGFKGPSRDGDGIVLACPLPTLDRLPEDPRDIASAGGHPLDAARLVDLMAKVWALSEMDPSVLNTRLTITAFRPDPIGLSLQSMIEDGSVPGRKAMVFAPAGKTPLVVKHGFALCRADLASRTNPGPRHPVTDVLSLKRAVFGHCSLEAALRELQDLSGEGAIELLDILPFTGSDMFQPAAIEVDVGITGNGAGFSDGWKVRESPRTMVRLGSWSGSVSAALHVHDLVCSEAVGIWEGEDAAPPGDLVRILMLCGPADNATLMMSVCLPPSCQESEDMISDRLAKALNPSKPVDSVEITGRVEEVILLGADLSSATTIGSSSGICGSASRVAAYVPECIEMGPTMEDAIEDPAGTAVSFATAYLDILNEELTG